MRRPFRSDRAATDPILVIAAIAVSLVLLVGGGFAVSGLIGNAQASNAQQDLGRVVAAEQALQAAGSSYTGELAALTGGAVGASFSDGVTPGLRASSSCFAGFAAAKNGQTFMVSSSRTAPTAVPSPWPTAAPAGYPAGCSWPSSASDALTSSTTNLLAPTVPSAGTPFESEWGGGSNGTITIRSDSSIDRPYQRNTFTADALNDGHTVVASPRGAAGVAWKPKTKYTWSEWVRPSVPVAGYSPTMFVYDRDGGTYSNSGSSTATIPANVWTQVSFTFTTPDVTVNGVWPQFRVGIPAVTAFKAGVTLDTTKAMLTEGSTLFTYGDASTPGWTTTGSGGTLVAQGPATAQ
ncbi:hypothetical protein ACWGJ9_11345 [Curtobacterium citreum]